MFLSIYTFRLLLVSVLITAFTVFPTAHTAKNTYAQDNQDAASEKEQATEDPNFPDIEPQVLTILKQMSDTLDSLTEFSFRADINFDEVLNSGQIVKLGGTSHIVVKRPNHVYAEFSGDRAERKAWYDGDKLTVINTGNGFYGQIDTPDTIDSTLDYLMKNYDFTLPLADLLHTDSYQAFTESAVTGVMVYDSKIGGKECSHLAFEGESIDWQVWVSKKEPTLPCKLVITYRDKEDSPEYEALFSDWKLDQNVHDSLFKPILPKDATKIDFIDVRKPQEAE